MDSVSFVQQHLSFVRANIVKILVLENFDVAADFNLDFFEELHINIPFK